MGFKRPRVRISPLRPELTQYLVDFPHIATQYAGFSLSSTLYDPLVGLLLQQFVPHIALLYAVFSCLFVDQYCKPFRRIRAVKLVDACIIVCRR